MVFPTDSANVTGVLDCEDVVELAEDCLACAADEVVVEVELVVRLVGEEFAKAKYPATAATTTITITTTATSSVEIARTLFLFCIFWRHHESEILTFTDYEPSLTEECRTRTYEN